MTEPPAVEVRDLKVVYNENSPNEVIALDGFSLQVAKGQSLIITGGNGTGKSTLLNAIAGSVPVKSGKIFLNGVDVTDWSPSRRGKTLGVVHQDTMLGTCPNLTLEENFQLTRVDRWWFPMPYRLKLTQNQIASIRNTGLPLDARGATKINMLSGGQRQAIAVCLAFENSKPILLFDEFTSALDEPTKTKVLEYTFHQARFKGTTVLMVMHDVSDLRGYSYDILSLGQ